MKVTEQTTQQIERFIKKIAQKFPKSDETSVLTDIHIRVSPDSGEMLAFNKDERFYDEAIHILRSEMKANAALIDNLGIMKPFSLVLEDDDKEPVGELYLADDDTVIIGGDLMKNLDADLDSFLDNLLKE